MNKLWVAYVVSNLFLAIVGGLLWRSQGSPITEFPYIIISGFISVYIPAVFILGAIASLILILWGCFKRLTSKGDKTKAEKAKYYIQVGLIWLVTIFVIFYVDNLIIALLGPPQLFELSDPSFNSK